LPIEPNSAGRIILASRRLLHFLLTAVVSFVNLKHQTTNNVHEANNLQHDAPNSEYYSTVPYKYGGSAKLSRLNM
jgi:hypothetical protein